MLPDLPVIALRARYVFPVSREPIADGVVTIQGDRIVAVGSDPGDVPVQDLGDVAILPGLVNAHTHLEFSDLTAPLGHPGQSFPDWIRQVIQYRRTSYSPPGEAIRQGLRESLAAGVTTLGEIATSGRQPVGWQPPLSDEDTVEHAADDPAMPDVVLFGELVCLSPERIDERVEEAQRHLSAAWNRRCIEPGLSPHATYTVHPDLLAHCAELSRRTRAPLAMHVAESPEELELLRTLGGPFRDLLVEFHAWNPEAIALGTRPLEYLRILSLAQRSLVIHGNYLDAEEHAFLAQHADRMSVVYCPRTHHYFRHSRYPLSEMLSAGVAVAAGTDGRGSNPDLNLWADLRFVAEHYPELSLPQVLELGTLQSARALGRSSLIGSLEPGKYADLAIVPLPSHGAADPHELLFAASGTASTWHRGREVHRAGPA